MKVLIVCSYNSGRINSFIIDQVESLKKLGIEFDYFKVIGKGGIGYLKNLSNLRRIIKAGNYDLIHAHYGLSGLLANLQRITPVIITYHGSDIHFIKNRILSYFSSRLAVFNILTNLSQKNLLKLSKDFALIPCGIDLNLFQPMDKRACREKLNLKEDRKYILFSSSFKKKVKNSNLAIEAVSNIENCKLIEFKGFSRYEVVELMNACDLLLVTSFYETGPLVVKEALACNTPVVSTDVGDVKQLITGVRNCYITSPNPVDVAEKIQRVLDSDRTCNGRKAVEPYENQRVARSVKDVYMDVLYGKGLKKQPANSDASQNI